MFCRRWFAAGFSHTTPTQAFPHVCAAHLAKVINYCKHVGETLGVVQCCGIVENGITCTRSLWAVKPQRVWSSGSIQILISYMYVLFCWHKMCIMLPHLLQTESFLFPSLLCIIPLPPPALPPNSMLALTPVRIYHSPGAGKTEALTRKPYESSVFHLWKRVIHEPCSLLMDR